jgi:hypothetical protein
MIDIRFNSVTLDAASRATLFFESLSLASFSDSFACLLRSYNSSMMGMEIGQYMLGCCKRGKGRKLMSRGGQSRAELSRVMLGQRVQEE